jgi:hypothetical protein
MLYQERPILQFTAKYLLLVDFSGLISSGGGFGVVGVVDKEIPQGVNGVVVEAVF